MIALATVTGGVTRFALMSIINYTFLRFDPPIGFGIPGDALAAMLPVIGFFNVTIALYTIPIAYGIARAVSLNMKIPVWK